MALLRKQLSSKFKSSRSTKIQYSKQNLPPGTIAEFVWKDYCTASFRSIQELGNVSYEDYMLSVCNHETLMELAMRGYCGRPFYVRPDNRFVIKMLRKSEAKVLMELLPSYSRHLEKNSSSLLAKIYGLHAARSGNGGPKIYFVVMENLIQTELQIHREYDLKGSSQGRNPTKTGTQSRLTLKDLEFDLCFYLDSPIRHQLLEQIKIDCKFLEDQFIMDYSLLLGVHIEHPSRANKDERNFQQMVQAEIVTDQSPRDDLFHEQNGTDPSSNDKFQPRLNRDPTLSDFFTDADRNPTRFGAKIPARAVKISRSMKEGSTTTGRKPIVAERSSVLLYIGIIDFLQSYNMIKRLEHAYKSLQYDAREISSVKPTLYSTRFQDFLSKVFLTEDLSPDQSHGLLLQNSTLI
ncbi:phosphatidylinositol 4-phosphate 5-kinase 10-like [Silene latifolia]|uniref:phosphatidylinositol 4-phosphate 5-kinase 10-like n=1 Tax=Silene latifolia TaxID=37657 RepID=UPI003D772AEF